MADWQKLSPKQKEFIVKYHREGCGSLAEAARECGLSPNTAYNWPDYFEDCLEEYSDKLVEYAMEEMREATVKAAKVKTEEVFDAGSTEESQQKAASDVLDRVLGKPTQKQEIESEVTVDAEQAMDDLLEATEKWEDS